jgi:hypothetical protein
MFINGNIIFEMFDFLDLDTLVNLKSLNSKFKNIMISQFINWSKRTMLKQIYRNFEKIT